MAEDRVATALPVMAGVGVFLGITNSFMIFEGTRGWCAPRAMGIKTPM